MRKYYYKILLLVILIQLVFSNAGIAGAANLSDAFGKVLQDSGEKMGYDVKSENTLESVAGSIISAFLSILGIIFIGFIIYGGYVWLLARGEADRVNTAKAIIRTSITGLIIILAAYAISIFVLSQIGSGTLSGVTGQ